MKLTPMSPVKPLDVLRDYVLERREYCNYYRSSRFDPIFKNAWSEYAPKSPDYSGTGDLDIPELWLRTEVLLANILSPFYGFDSSPLQPYGDVYQTHQRADKIAMLWEFRSRQMKFNRLLPEYFRQAIITGSSMATMLWDIRHDYVSKTRPIYVTGYGMGRVTKRYYEKVYSGPDMAVLDVMDCAVDPDATSCDLDKALDVVVERWMTQEEIERLIEQGHFSPDGYKIDWQRVEGRWGVEGIGANTDGAKTAMGLAPMENTMSRGRKPQVRVAEWWGRYNIPKTRLWIPMVVTIADPDGQKILLRPWKEVPMEGNNPFNHGRKPFVLMNYVTRPFSPYGQGLYEITASTSEAYQVKVNARLKNIGLLLNKMYAYNPNLVRNIEALLNQRPGGVVEVMDDPRKAIMPLEYQDILQSISAQIFEFRDLLDELSGVNALMRSGSANPGGKTPVSALEVNAKQQMAGERFKFLVGLMMEQGPVALADMELAMEEQFMEGPTQMMTLRQQSSDSTPTPEFFEITPEDLAGKFKYYFVADPLRTNDMMRTNQKITIFGLLTNPVYATVIRKWYVARELMKAGNIPFQEGLIPESVALQQELMQFTMQAQQGAAQSAMAMTAPLLQAQAMAEAEKEKSGGKTNDKGRPVSPVPGSSVEGTPMLPPVPSQENPAGAAAAPIENGGVMA